MKFYDVIIIGGGFFGCKIALHLNKKFKKILIIERENDLLQRASYINQARVHNGYHYPRSILTSLRSHVNFPKFTKEYKQAIVKNFNKYYGIGKNHSKVTALQYIQFCKRVGIPLKPAPEKIKNLFNKNTIEDVFRAQEYAFDAKKLKEILLNQLESTKVKISLNTKVVMVRFYKDSQLIVRCKTDKKKFEFSAKHVFNCTYSQINAINHRSRLPIIPLKQELTEMTLIDTPDLLKKNSFTIMCGPFFSIMPFPPRKLCTLSHVRYTPHTEWLESKTSNYKDAQKMLNNFVKKSNFQFMKNDAARYLPIINEIEYKESLWELKTLMPESETDDSRPILFSRNHGVKNYVCVMGGKIDNIYDVLKEIDEGYF